MRKVTQTVDPGGMSITEIAAREGCSKEEVSMLIKSALQKLRNRAIGGKHAAINQAKDCFYDRGL